jgi:transcriptional regulator with XRE-family HTH domain
MTEHLRDIEPWIEYVQRHAHGAKQEDIAGKIGVTSSTVGRWKDTGIQPRGEHVVAFARAYGRAPVEALIHAGYIKPEEAGISSVELAGSMHDVTDRDLMKELADRLADFRRLQRGGESQEWPPPDWRN